MANKKVRVLVAGVIGAVAFRCNDVVNLPDALIKAHADAVDANKESVAYALEQNGGVVIDYVDPDSARRDALEAKLQELNARLTSADESTKLEIEAAIASCRAELAALN